MVRTLDNDKNKDTARKVNVTTILIGIIGIGFLAICSIVSGIISLKLSNFWWSKIAGTLSIIQGALRFIDIGIFAERVARRPWDNSKEDENLVGNVLDIIMGTSLLISGIINVRLSNLRWMKKIGIVGIAVAGCSIINSLGSLIYPIVSKGQKQPDLFEDNILKSKLGTKITKCLEKDNINKTVQKANVVLITKEIIKKEGITKSNLPSNL